MTQSDASVGSACVFTKPFLPWRILSGIHIKIKTRFAPIFVLCFLKASGIICSSPLIYSPTSVCLAERCLAVWAHLPAWRSQLLAEEQERWQLVRDTGVLHRRGASSYIAWAKALRWKLRWASCAHTCIATALVLGDARLHRLTAAEGAIWIWRLKICIFLGLYVRQRNN